MDALTERCELRVGTTFRGKWTLERLVGVGGMAAVYVAAHKIGRRDAIKILHPEIAEDQQLAARFEQEAHAVNRFKHPGAVEILDVDFSDAKEPFLVMELLEGESLDAVLKKGRLEIGDVLKIADELLDVLAAAHAAGIVHRDIKPENLFIVDGGRLKVLDFGIARFVKGTRKSVHTAVGVTIGTLAYMPPEQVAGKEIDHRADIFAVGCTMFCLLTGRTPHVGETDLELMVKVGMEPAPPLASIAPHLPRDLCAVVDRALAFDRDRRYPGARTMQNDVRALREGREPSYALERILAGDAMNVGTRDERGRGPIARALADSNPSSQLGSNDDLPAVSAGPSPPSTPAASVAGVASTTISTERRRANSFVIAITGSAALVLGIGIAAAWAMRATARADEPDPIATTLAAATAEPVIPASTSVATTTAPPIITSATTAAPITTASTPSSATSSAISPEPDPTAPVIATPQPSMPPPMKEPREPAPKPKHKGHHHR